MTDPTQTELLRVFAAVVTERGDQVRALLPDGQAAALLDAVARFVAPGDAQGAGGLSEDGSTDDQPGD